MKVKVTKEKLYPIFKKFMETYFKNYEWRKGKFDSIWFIDPEGYGHMGLTKNKELLIYREIKKNIRRFLPMEESMLKSLMCRWVEETLQVEGLTVPTVPQFTIPRFSDGDTFPL
jgi:hypothetical protein